MANKVIKGLTVEIGGDTTNLGKALDAADKQSRSLSAELSQIDKLLKFDDANPELLAQKQKVLTDQISETAQKLQLLQTAQTQATEAFQRGEVSEAQLRAIEREIISAENALEKYRTSADDTAQKINSLGTDTQNAANAVKPLTETVKEQESELAKLKSDYVNVAAAQGAESDEAKKLLSEIGNLSAEIAGNQQKMQSAKQTADQFDSTIAKNTSTAKTLSETVRAQKNDLSALKSQYADTIAEQGAESDAAKQLANQIGTLSAEIVQNQQKLSDSEKAADAFDRSMQDAGTGSKTLKQTIADQKSELSALKDSYAEAAAAQGKDSAEAQRLAAQITALSGDLQTNQQRLNDAESAANSLDETVETLGESEKETGNETNAFGDTLKSALVSGASAACDALGSLVSMTGSAISAVANAAFDFAKDSVEAGKGFDAAVSQIGATMGYTTEQLHDSTSQASQNLQMLRDKAQEMGAATSFSATEAAEGLNILAMSGYSAEQSCEMIGDVLNLAAAGGLSLAEAASYTSGAVKGFADETKDAQYYTDLMARGATLANTDVKALGEALSGGAASAASYGQSADGFTVSLLRMAEQGVTGSDAATALSRAMADIYTPTDGAKKAMEALGVSAYTTSGEARDFNTVADELNKKLATMSDEEANAYKNALFSSRGLQAFNKMTVTSTEKVNEWAAALSDATGSAAAQAETMLDNLQGDLTIFGSAMEGAQLVISDALSPTLREFVQIGTDGISELTAAFKSGGLTGALDAVGDIADKELGKINDILPGIISTASEIVNALSAQLPRILEAVLPTVTDGLMQMLGGVTAMLPDLLSVLSTVLAEIVDALADMIPDASQKLLTALVNLAPYLSMVAVNLISVLAETVISMAPDILRTVMRTAESIISALGSTLPDLLDTLFSDVIPALITNFFAYLPDVIEALSNVISAIAKRLPSIVKKLTDYLPEIISTIVYGITQSVPVILGAVTDVIKAVISSVPVLLESLPELIDLLLDGIMELLPEIIDGLTSLVDAIVDALPDLISRITAVLPQIVTAIVNALTALMPQIIECGLHLLTAIVGALPQIIGTICDALPTLIKGITDALLKLVPQIIQCGITLLTSLVSALPDIIRQIVSVLPQIITGIVNALLDMLPMLIDCGVQLLVSLVENLPEIMTQIIKVLPDIIDGIISALLDMLPELIECGVTLFVALVENLPTIIAKIIEAVPKIISSIVDAIENRISAIAEVGSRLIEGLWQGIKDMGAWIHDKISGFFDGIVDGIKDFFGIASPSKLMRDLVGKNIAVGIAKGISDEENTVQNAMDEIADDIADTKIVPPDVPEITPPDAPEMPVLPAIPEQNVKYRAEIENPDVPEIPPQNVTYHAQTELPDIPEIPEQTVFYDTVTDDVTVPEPETQTIQYEGDFPEIPEIPVQHIEFETNLDAVMQSLSALMAKTKLQPEPPVFEPEMQFDSITSDLHLNNPVTQIVMLDTQTMDKLDAILNAVEQGQVIALDGDKLVGGTADKYNSAFGEMQILTERSVQ